MFEKQFATNDLTDPRYRIYLGHFLINQQPPNNQKLMHPLCNVKLLEMEDSNITDSRI